MILQTFKRQCFWIVVFLCHVSFVKAQQTPQAVELDQSLQSTVKTKSKIAIVIDDLGNQQSLGRDAIDLMAAKTIAVMPKRPFSQLLAKEAFEAEKEVIIHMPMENASRFPLGELGLTTKQTKQEVENFLQAAYDDNPFAVGLNNHTGSVASENKELMNWVTTHLSQKGLYFFDSMTSAQSVGWREAQNINLPTIRRDVFLDNDLSSQALNHQFQRALKIANKKGQVVVIAHPHKESIAFLNDQYERHKEQFDWVKLSSLIVKTESLKLKSNLQKINPKTNTQEVEPNRLDKEPIDVEQPKPIKPLEKEPIFCQWPCFAAISR